MPVTIRPVEQNDIPTMAAIRALYSQIRALYSQTHAYWSNRIAGYLSGEHSPQQALPQRAAFIALDGATIAGFVAGHRTRRFDCDAELEWVDVVEQHRKQGIAGQLIRQIATWFVEQDALRVCVNVASDNAAGRSLYAKCGAQAFGDYWMIWPDVRAIMTHQKPPLA